MKEGEMELVVEDVEEELKITSCKPKNSKYYIWGEYAITFKGYFIYTLPAHARTSVRVCVYLDHYDEEFRKYLSSGVTEACTGYYLLDNLYNNEPQTFTRNFKVTIRGEFDGEVVDGVIFCLPFKLYLSDFSLFTDYIRLYYKYENCSATLHEIVGLPCPQMLECKLIKDMVYIKFKINKAGYYKIMANDTLISKEYFSKGIHEKYFSKNMFPTGKVKIRIEKD